MEPDRPEVRRGAGHCADILNPAPKYPMDTDSHHIFGCLSASAAGKSVNWIVETLAISLPSVDEFRVHIQAVLHGR
jgi:hypothetical protein